MDKQKDTIKNNVSIGKYLHNARISKSLSIKEVSKQTKIKTVYLKAIESDDFSSFLSLGYARANTYTYARFLKVDFDIERLKEINNFKKGKKKETVKKQGKEYILNTTRIHFMPFNVVWIIPILVLLAILTFLTYTFYKKDLLNERLLEKEKQTQQVLPTKQEIKTLGNTNYVSEIIYNGKNPLDEFTFVNDEKMVYY